MLHYFAVRGEKIGSSLTPRGREQMRLLARHLNSLGFSGEIFFSPSEAERESAQILASQTGARLRACPSFPDQEGESDPACSVARVYRDLLPTLPDREVLFVTEPSVCDAFLSLFEMKKKGNTFSFNASLSVLDPLRWKTDPVLRDVSFLPYEMVTLDGRSREEMEEAYMTSPFQGELCLPDLSAFTGKRLLHIGDTESSTYPFYRELIRRVRPHVILHTGDLVDEVKIERHPEYRAEYTAKLKAFARILRESGASLILVWGNHDLPDVMKEVFPDATILPPNSELLLDGIPCRVGHKVREMTFDRKYSFFGHGLAGDPWRYALNLPGGPYRFSSAYGSFVLDLKKELFLRIPRFYC